jgi:hypothetical protein
MRHIELRRNGQINYQHGKSADWEHADIPLVQSELFASFVSWDVGGKIVGAKYQVISGLLFDADWFWGSRHQRIVHANPRSVHWLNRIEVVS